MTSRRHFLQGILALGALAALPDRVGAASPRRLVLIHLFGGNDGLNTVVPYDQREYRQARPALGLKASEVLPLTRGLGLHPALAPLQPLWERKKMAIFQGVGYKNPNRSHFLSADVWQSAACRGREGWLGRLAAQEGWDTVQVDDSSLVRALWSEQGRPALCFQPEQKNWKPPTALQGALRQLYSQSSSSSLRQTYARLQQIPTCLGERWQGPPLEQRLRAILGLWPLGRLFHTSLGGFDTHSGQRQRHGEALGQLAAAVADFYQELQRRDWEKDTCIVVYSEFGRRVEENGSEGTDHGGAAPLFVLGGGVAGGLYGEHPSLKNLVDGDLAFGLDFRQVYASVVEDWLHCRSEKVLGGRFARIPCWR